MKSRLKIQKTRKLFINGAFPRSESERYIKWTSSDGKETVNISCASRKDFRDSVRAARKAKRILQENVLKTPKLITRNWELQFLGKNNFIQLRKNLEMNYQMITT